MDEEELLELLESYSPYIPPSKESDERSTPQELFDELDAEFHFTLDVCATHENTKVYHHYFTKQNNALNLGWTNHICFMNPPYSNISEWLGKAKYESLMKNVIVVCILPCDTSTRWFHDYLWFSPEHKPQIGVQLRFPKGRYKFGGYKTSPQFATIIAVLRHDMDR